MDQKDLRIATWNANSIQNRKQEIELFLKAQDIDICLVSETHLTNQSWLKINGYQVYQTIHPDNKAKEVVLLLLRIRLTTMRSVDVYKRQVCVCVCVCTCARVYVRANAVSP